MWYAAAVNASPSLRSVCRVVGVTCLCACAAPYAFAVVPFGRAWSRASKFDENAWENTSSAGAGDGDDAAAVGSVEDHDSVLSRAILEENYYDILGLGDVGCNATDEDIKKACASRVSGSAVCEEEERKRDNDRGCVQTASCC